jgi:ammonia channel protein AmtB
VILKIVDRIFGLRVQDYEEVSGLDLTQHVETAYATQ